MKKKLTKNYNDKNTSSGEIKVDQECCVHFLASLTCIFLTLFFISCHLCAWGNLSNASIQAFWPGSRPSIISFRNSFLNAVSWFFGQTRLVPPSWFSAVLFFRFFSFFSGSPSESSAASSGINEASSSDFSFVSSSCWSNSTLFPFLPFLFVGFVEVLDVPGRLESAGLFSSPSCLYETVWH